MSMSIGEKSKIAQLPVSTTERKSFHFLVCILLLQFVIYFLAFFNVQIARQIVVFVYFTFVPGFIVVKLLRMNELDRTEIILFSIGFSLSFLMIVGLLIDVLGLALGFLELLSTVSLMLAFNTFILIGAILAYLRKENVRLFAGEGLRLPTIALILIFLPILGIAGAMQVTINNYNSIILAGTLVIAMVFIAGIALRRIFPSKAYPLAIVAIALFLLYQSTFISQHLVWFGSDVANEFFLAKFTQNHAFWSSVSMFPGNDGYGRLYSMISVTVLPTVYSNLLNMDMTWVFKILYPLIFSLVPLGLYQLWQSMIGKKRAFIAAFLFMAQSTFYSEMLGLARQMIAELFFVLLLIVIVDRRMKKLNKTICFIVFGFALVISHYALAEIFLIFISAALIYLIVSKKKGRQINIALVAFFFVAMFSWYIYTSGSAAFNSFLSFGNYVYGQLGSFLNPSSRGQTVLVGLGLETAPSVWNTISRAFAYLTEALIVLGIVGLITRRVNVRFERIYFFFTLAAFAVLIALVAVPALASTLNMTRFYHILLFFLAPVCVLGADFVVQLVPKRWRKIDASVLASILLVVVLVPYFLFQTGFVYEVAGIQSWSLPLSKHRMDAFFLATDMGYFNDSEAIGALWMSRNVNFNSSIIYADYNSIGLLATSNIYVGDTEVLSNTTALTENSFIYLNSADLFENTALGPNYVWNTTNISNVLDSNNLVYSNGGCQVYKVIPH